MKRFHGVLAAVAALAFASGVATACDGEKTAQKVSAQTVSAGSCSAAKAASLTASSCGSAKAASLTAASCSSAKAAGMTASSCSSAMKAAGMTAASCANACATTHVVYRVGESETFDRAEAMAMAEKAGAPLQFVAAGTAFEDENSAKMAMTQAIHSRINEMLIVSTTVGGEAYSCGVSAAKTAEKTGAPMRFIVAGREFEAKDAADAYLTKARAAVEMVKLVDAEGNSVEGCAVSHCKTNGMTAFTLGDQKIKCPVTANYTAAQAKMAAILSTDA